MHTTQVTEEESRLIQRISMQLPVKIEVRVDQNLTWEEITRIRDVSTYGAGFILSRPVKRGRLVFVTIPMPRKLRTYDFAEPQYMIWGIVRRCIKITQPRLSEDKYSIGIGFIGKNVPESYLADPSTVYDIVSRGRNDLWNITESNLSQDDSDLLEESRRHSRYQIPTEVTVEILDGDGDPIASEQTTTENLSLSGAAIYTTFTPSVGDFLRLHCKQYNLSIISIVRGIRVGDDNIQRLHIEFIDRFFPLDGIIK